MYIIYLWSYLQPNMLFVIWIGFDSFYFFLKQIYVLGSSMILLFQGIETWFHSLNSKLLKSKSSHQPSTSPQMQVNKLKNVFRSETPKTLNIILKLILKSLELLAISNLEMILAFFLFIPKVAKPVVRRFFRCNWNLIDNIKFRRILKQICHCFLILCLYKIIQIDFCWFWNSCSCLIVDFDFQGYRSKHHEGVFESYSFRRILAVLH